VGAGLSYTADDAQGRRIQFAKRISNGKHQLPNLETACISHLSRRRASSRERPLDLKDCQIVALRPGPDVRGQALTTD